MVIKLLVDICLIVIRRNYCQHYALWEITKASATTPRIADAAE